MRAINKIKTTKANGKKKLGTNLPGLRIRTGIVPVNIPTGQISVKINPITYEVMKTVPMRSPYFI
jgi:hypothetical protein